MPAARGGSYTTSDGHKKRFIVANVAPHLDQSTEAREKKMLANKTVRVHKLNLIMLNLLFYLQIFGDRRKVKFENIRRDDHNDLFTNPPALNENIPKYHKIR